MDTLQRLYNSEISFEIRAEWEAGFEWKLGDWLNGYIARGYADSYDGAVDALVLAACEYFPMSSFAQERRRIA